MPNGGAKCPLVDEVVVVRGFWLIRTCALLVLAAVLLAPSLGWARATATGMRLGAHPGGITRIVVDLSDSIDFSTALYADPYRVVVNTPPMDWSQQAALRRPLGAVQALRFDEDSLGGRLMIDLKEPATVKSAFVIPPRDGQGWRFVMDLQVVSRAAFLNAAMPMRTAKAELKPEPPKPAAAPRAEIARAPLPLPEARPQAEPVSMQPEAPRPIIITSPDAAPSVAASPSVPVVQPAPAPVVQPAVAVQSAPEPRPAQRTKTGAPVLSQPVPPPLERPAVVQPAVAAMPALAAPEPTSAPVTKAAMAVPAPQPLEPVEPKALPADGKPVVVIDPGHGGVDPGAIGVSGIYEKYITLAVARELKASLERNGRYKVYLTRDRDIFIRLRDRVAIARQYNADLFISLHADSVANPQLKGLSVYTLSQNASDSEAQALADKENKADLIAGIDLSHESADVANILIDLAQRETMNRSAGFAGGVVDEVGREQTLLGNTHRFAGFAVLKAPDVPSVLVEMGYLSNEAEERNLRQPEYRVKLAKGLSRAVDRFFLQGQKAARRP